MKRPEFSLLKAEIETSLADLDRIVDEIEQALKDIGSSVPSYRDKAAMGAFLHNFYNGIEKHPEAHCRRDQWSRACRIRMAQSLIAANDK